MFVLLIPLNQGLKPALCYCSDVFLIVCFADSIKSRIETENLFFGFIEHPIVCFADSIKSRIETFQHLPIFRGK